MAKTKVTKTGAAKTLGKAVIRVTDNSEVTHENLLTNPQEVVIM